jgi:hypothetical protein
MDILNNQITLSVGTPVLILIGFVLLAIFGVIVYLAVRLRKATHLQPKYGFLGKSLYPVVTVMLLGAGIVMAIVSINSDKIFQLKAQKQVQAEIFTNILIKDPVEYYIDLKAVPTVEGKIWGPEGSTYDIYWTLSGKKDYKFVELSKSNEDRSGVQTYVLPGSYKISLSVIFEDNVYTFSKDVTF